MQKLDELINVFNYDLKFLKTLCIDLSQNDGSLMNVNLQNTNKTLRLIGFSQCVNNCTSYDVFGKIENNILSLQFDINDKIYKNVYYLEQ